MVTHWCSGGDHYIVGIMKKLLPLLALALIPLHSDAQRKKSEAPEPQFESSLVSGLKMRSIGPAMMSGRISDLAVNPKNPFEYYITVASGGVWKTSNAGTTYEPIFDSQGSYSIGCVTIAPSNENVVWVGTGENNNQRSVAYGDGVYRSLDGGKSWKNMGLNESEHIGKIVVHPNDENTVYVAAYGPLWSAGGERGIYKSTDGGENWERILEISKHTGVNDIVMDPRDPKVLYAAAHQRRRHVWTYIDGGPESAIYKTIDGGENWKKLENGLPENDMGRIGLAISPADPDVVYAIIKATEKGGFYRSTDRGGSWKKMSDYQTSGNYYQEIVCDPYDVDKVFSMNTWLHHTEDGGKTFKRTGEKHKHVDNHCMWIDPQNTDHWIVGCDGGIYETWDHASNWNFKPNLPITQFYKVGVDNAEPLLQRLWRHTGQQHPWVDLRGRSRIRASITAIGSSPMAATDSNHRSTRPMRISFTGKPNTVGWSDSIRRAASALVSNHNPRKAKSLTAGIGMPHCLYPLTITNDCISAPTRFSRATIEVIPGRSSAMI